MLSLAWTVPQFADPGAFLPRELPVARREPAIGWVDDPRNKQVTARQTVLAVAAAAATVAGVNVQRQRRHERRHTHRTTRVVLPSHTSVLQCNAQLKAQTPAKVPRVRFAPSPTGSLHVGGARTALFNWLFARSQGGTMILRIEDTDVVRSTAASEKQIIDSLRWMGITWDEGPDIGGGYGPYRQMERIRVGIYQRAIQQLLESGHAYRCFLTEEDLLSMRREAEKNGEVFIVDSPWARASEEEVQEMLARGRPFAVRFRMPNERLIQFEDMVLGEVVYNTRDLSGDFVILRANGIPMYNFGAVVDDVGMDITHVLRAQEHLTNTPKQILLYEALGFEPPKFGHMPLILSPDRSKLSKRHGAASVEDFKREGYLPEGLMNYLSLLGWSDGTSKEIYSADELIRAFKMDRMLKVGAIFNQSKCRWVNTHHLRQLSEEKSTKLIGEELVRQGLLKKPTGKFLELVAQQIQSQIAVISQSADKVHQMLDYPLKALMETENGTAILNKPFVKETARLLVFAHKLDTFAHIGGDIEAFKKIASCIQDTQGVSRREAFHALRVCLTGKESGMDLGTFFELVNCVDENVLIEPISLVQRIEILRETLGI